MALWLLISAFVGCVLSNPTPPPLDCSSRSDGVYWWGCRAYQMCQGGQEQLISCSEGEAFNPEQKTCQPIFTVPPPCGLELQCPPEKSGAHRFADADNSRLPCNFFYTCMNGEFLGHQQCNEGTVFDEVNQLCNWPENVYPPCGTKTDEGGERTGWGQQQIGGRRGRGRGGGGGGGGGGQNNGGGW